jgi:hypothetical protein
MPDRLILEMSDKGFIKKENTIWYGWVILYEQHMYQMKCMFGLLYHWEKISFWKHTLKTETGQIIGLI